MIRIFVVGYQRSGTTLLQSLLGAHDVLATFSESRLFKRAFRYWRLYRPLHKRRGPIAPRVDEFLRENGLQALCESEAVRPFQAIDKRRWVRGIELAEEILSLFDRITIVQNKSGWIEKTPQHLYYCDLIAAAAPMAHFVHIARLGEDAVASLVVSGPKWQGYEYASPIRSARLWNSELKRSLRYADNPQHHFVTYEDLTESPLSEVKRLFTELGVPPDPHVFDRYRDVAKQVVLPEETWKALNVQSIQRRSTFTEVFNETERSRVLNVLNAKLYERFRQLSRSGSKFSPPS
jgi:hypothetical protein